MANFVDLEANESTVNGEFTFNLTRMSTHITIINDDLVKDLRYKFKFASGWCTLKSKETISMEFSTNQVIVSGDNVEYRIWSFA